MSRSMPSKRKGIPEQRTVGKKKNTMHIEKKQSVVLTELQPELPLRHHGLLSRHVKT